MPEPLLRVHAIVPRSRVNGPGVRAVIWTQGCSMGCAGCFNVQTHGTQAGTLMPVDEVVAGVRALDGIEGVTISGGEPLQQPQATLALLRQLRATTQLSTLLFTGYGWDEIQRMPVAGELPHLLDVVIAGRYDATQRVAAQLIGSANKHIAFFTDRYTRVDLASVPPAEMIIGSDGTVTISGINPPALRIIN